jgi:hypothetical protein
LQQNLKRKKFISEKLNKAELAISPSANAKGF